MMYLFCVGVFSDFFYFVNVGKKVRYLFVFDMYL